jgi:hypothetical protein
VLGTYDLVTWYLSKTITLLSPSLVIVYTTSEWHCKVLEVKLRFYRATLSGFIVLGKQCFIAAVNEQFSSKVSYSFSYETQVADTYCHALIQQRRVHLVDHESLTHSLMELNPSWEAANCAATQELARILWNPEVHYRVHKSPPLVPIPSQIDPIHSIPSYLSKIHFNIVHPPTSWSSQWSRFSCLLVSYSLTHGAEPFLRICQFCSYSKNIPYWAIDFLRRFCCISLIRDEFYHPVFTSLNFTTIIFSKNKIVSLASNPQPGGLGLCIYVPQWQGVQVTPPGTGFPFNHILWLAVTRRATVEVF